MILVLAIFLVFLGVGSSAPVIRSWTLAEVETAVADPKIAPNELKSLVEQIREGVYPNFVENHLLKSPTGQNTWSVQELDTVINNLDSDLKKYPEYRKWLSMAKIFALWNNKSSVYVQSPSERIQTWAMSDLIKYLENSRSPNRPFHKQVRDHHSALEEAIKNGKKWNTIPMMTIPDYYYDPVPSNELYG